MYYPREQVRFYADWIVDVAFIVVHFAAFDVDSVRIVTVLFLRALLGAEIVFLLRDMDVLLELCRKLSSMTSRRFHSKTLCSAFVDFLLRLFCTYQLLSGNDMQSYCPEFSNAFLKEMNTHVD